MATGRDRILTALSGGEPDRIPCALAFYPVAFHELAPEGFDLTRHVDAQFVRPEPSPSEQHLTARLECHPLDTRLGSPDQIRTYGRWQYRPEDARSRNPLAAAQSLADLEAFGFPDPAGEHDLPALAARIAGWREQGLAVGGNLPHLGGELFESAWRIRGLENFLLDLVERPDWAEFLLDRLTDIARANARLVAAAGVDLLSLDDDVGMPGTMFISPALWRTFLKPRLASVISATRAVRPGLPVLYHSEGVIDPILDDLVEIGVGALNPVQPEFIDASAVRRRYGSRLTIWGAMGRQTTMSFADPAAIAELVRTLVDSLGRAALVLCPAYDVDEPDIPWANIKAFLSAVRTYGS